MTEFEEQAKRRRDFDHQMHVNINRRQDARRKSGEAWEYWLYEAKGLGGEIARLTRQFERERTGQLPNSFKYCSLSPVESVPENKLICCLGAEPKTCPILLDALQGTESFPAEMIDQAKAHVCVTHILSEAAKRLVDTTEGYITDATDRAFWERTYKHMSMPEPEEGENADVNTTTG